MGGWKASGIASKCIIIIIIIIEISRSMKTLLYARTMIVQHHLKNIVCYPTGIYQ